MKKIEINGIIYEIVRNDDNCFQKDIFEEKITDYFFPFDYILADYAYERFRLKGFYDSKNKKSKTINDIKNIDNYIENYCSLGAKIVILKKIK